MTGTKIDTIKIRQLNREQTFEYIKKNPMAARADVAKELNLSFPTVTSIVTELEEAGLIRAEKSTTNTGGRSSMAYSCDENARCAIGIQLSERYMKGLVPNCLSTIIVLVTLGIPNAIMYEASLSFLGIGIQPPTPSWGNMISAAQTFISFRPVYSIMVWLL